MVYRAERVYAMIYLCVLWLCRRMSQNGNETVADVVLNLSEFKTLHSKITTELFLYHQTVVLTRGVSTMQLLIKHNMTRVSNKYSV